MVQVICTLHESESGKANVQRQLSLDLGGSDVAALMQMVSKEKWASACAMWVAGPVLQPFLSLPERDLGAWCESLVNQGHVAVSSLPTIVWDTKTRTALVKTHSNSLPEHSELIPGACYNVFRVEADEDDSMGDHKEAPARALPKAAFSTTTSQAIQVILCVHGFEAREASLDPSMTVGELSASVLKACGAEASAPVWLRNKGTLSSENARLSECGVRVGSVIEVGPRRAGRLDLFVKLLTGKKVSVSLKTAARVDQLKAAIQNSEGIPTDQMRLIFAGKQLEDWRPLADYGIGNEAEVHLILRLRGGMFHPTSGAMGFAKCGEAEDAEHMCNSPERCDGHKTSVRVVLQGGEGGGGDDTVMVQAFACETKEDLTERIRAAAAGRGGRGGVGEMVSEIQELAAQLPEEERSGMLGRLLEQMRRRVGGRGGGA